MKRIFLICALIVLSQNVFTIRAQSFTLKGCVLSEETSAPVAGLVVSIQSEKE